MSRDTGCCLPRVWGGRNKAWPADTPPWSEGINPSVLQIEEIEASAEGCWGSVDRNTSSLPASHLPGLHPATDQGFWWLLAASALRGPGNTATALSGAPGESQATRGGGNWGTWEGAGTGWLEEPVVGTAGTGAGRAGCPGMGPTLSFPWFQSPEGQGSLTKEVLLQKCAQKAAEVSALKPGAGLRRPGLASISLWLCR